jgi:hypothetical protein
MIFKTNYNIKVKMYSIQVSNKERHDKNHKDFTNCIHCHFTLFTCRFSHITIEDYLEKYKIDLLYKLHKNCEYPECCICNIIKEKLGTSNTN